MQSRKRDFLKYLGFHTAATTFIMNEQPEALDPKLIDLIAKGRTAFHEGVSSPLGNFILGIHFAFKDLSAPASPVEETDCYCAKNGCEDKHSCGWYNYDNVCTRKKGEPAVKPSPVIEIGEGGVELEGCDESLPAVKAIPGKCLKDIEKAWRADGNQGLAPDWYVNGAIFMYRHLTEAKASHPAPALIVGEREEDQWHPQDYSGRNAPVSFYCTKPSTKPCSQQCAICAAYDPAPAEEAVPEEVKYDTIIPDFQRLYFLECKRWEDTMEVMEGKDKRIDELEQLIKEKQEWIDSHI